MLKKNSYEFIRNKNFKNTALGKNITNVVIGNSASANMTSNVLKDSKIGGNITNTVLGKN